MLVALTSGIAGVTAWEHGNELAGQDYVGLGGVDLMCFALFGAPNLVIVGGTLVFVAAEVAARPPGRPRTF